MNVSFHLQDNDASPSTNIYFKPPRRPWSPLSKDELHKSIVDYELKYGRPYEPPGRRYHGLEEDRRSEACKSRVVTAGDMWHTRLYKPKPATVSSSATQLAGKNIVGQTPSALTETIPPSIVSSSPRSSTSTVAASHPTFSQNNSNFSSHLAESKDAPTLSIGLLRRYRAGLHGSKLHSQHSEASASYPVLPCSDQLSATTSAQSLSGSQVGLPHSDIPRRNRLRATLRQEMIPSKLLDETSFTPLESSLLNPLPSAWKNDGSALLWQRKTVAQGFEEQYQALTKSKRGNDATSTTANALTSQSGAGAASSQPLTAEQIATANRKANKIRALYRSQRLDPVSRIHGFLSDPASSVSATEADSSLQKPSSSLAMFAPTLRSNQLTPDRIEKLNPRMKLDEVLQNHKHNRRSIHLLWTRFKALCGLGKDPKGVSLEVFRRGVPPLAAEDTLFVRRVYELVDTDGSGAIDWEEFLATVSALEQDSLESQCKFFFQIYDLDGDGLITRRDLEKMFARSAMLLPEDEEEGKLCSSSKSRRNPQSVSRPRLSSKLSRKQQTSANQSKTARKDDDYSEGDEDAEDDDDLDVDTDTDNDAEDLDDELSEDDEQNEDDTQHDSAIHSNNGNSSQSSNSIPWDHGSSASSPADAHSKELQHRKGRSRKPRNRSDTPFMAPTPLLLEACGGLAAPSERLLKALEIACTAPRGLDAHTPVVSLFSGKTGFSGSGSGDTPLDSTAPVSADIDVGREPTEAEIAQANKTAKRAVRTFVEKVFQRFGKSAARGDGISLDEVIDFMKNLRTGEDVWTVFGRLMRPISVQTSSSASPFHGDLPSMANR